MQAKRTEKIARTHQKHVFCSNGGTTCASVYYVKEEENNADDNSTEKVE